MAGGNTRSLLVHLPELIEVQRLASHGAKGLVRVQELTMVRHKDLSLPVLAIEFGSQDPKAPVFFLTAGVHGLERIGTRVVISYLKTLTNMAHWDPSTKALLSRVRFSVIPIINPVGMYLGRRSNGNGVDLMRNAPIEADHKSGISIAAGHRISNHLPWFRGVEGSGMEIEAKAMISY
ncbi:MAG: M14 family zinc carboxypeptidase, partial [Pseudomonadota bacterium]